MTAELALAAEPGMIERSADPAGFVVQACQRAKAWLREALEHGEIEQIAEIKSQAEAVRVYTTQKQLGKDAQLAAAEIVRRAERGLGTAIRRGQENGEIARRGDRGGRGAPGIRGGNPGDARGDHLDSSAGFFRNGKERAGAYAMADGVSDEEFEDALGQAKADEDLSRANVVRKVRQRRGNPAGPGRQVPDPADRSPDAAARRRELIGEFSGTGMTSAQIGDRLGIRGERVRQLAREHGITIQADAVLGRRRRLDSTRIARETVHALEGLAMGVKLANPGEIDPAEVPEWAVSMRQSLRVLRRFARQIEEVTSQ
ncbi:MAG: hypothetical protein J2P30_21355 [Actinobacteria bacterium]|nr:hypothetical protein [Actinomycetota bacterium]